MIRSFVFLFVSLLALGQELCHGQTLVPEPALPFSCSTFSSTVSEADLRARFGETNVTTAQVPWGGAEGDTNEGTVLFAGTSDAKVEIYWRDRVGKRLPEWIRVRGNQSRWRTPGGITLGTALTTIEKLNERPFRLLGFAHDAAGTVMSWSGGRLEAQDRKDCRVRIRLEPKPDSAGGAADRLVRQVWGDREFSSGHPAMQTLDPAVYELFLQYGRAPENTGNDARPGQLKVRNIAPGQGAVSTVPSADGCVSSGCHVRLLSIKQRHFPGQAQSCDACHTQRYPDHPGRPGREFGPRMEKLDDICFSCHSAFFREFGTTTVIHAPVAEGRCDACHDSHGTDFPMLLRNVVLVSEWESAPGPPFIDITKLCWQCHDRRILQEKQPADVTRFRDGDRNLHVLHASKRKNRGCKTCHETHAGRQPALMRDDVPFGRGWKLPIRFTRTSNGGSCVVGCHIPREYDREHRKRMNP